MYYSLGTDGLENVYMGLEEMQNSHINLMRGKSFDAAADDIDLPYRYTMTVAEGQEPRLHALYKGSFLMERGLLDAIRAAGVDNVQDFPAQIRSARAGAEVPGFVTYNIIGKVSCAAPKESTSVPIVGNAKYFKNLVIYPGRAQGQLMFRLKESALVILVHESVANAIRQGNFTGITLEPVAEAEEP